MSHCGNGNNGNVPDEDSSDTLCNDALCTEDLCPDGKGRRQVGTDCCSCELSLEKKASSAVSSSALLLPLLVCQVVAHAC